MLLSNLNEFNKVDLIIKNGLVVSSDQVRKANIYINNEKIIAIDDNLQEITVKADQEIEASGKLVIPGGIDVHTHLDMPFMGTKSVDDFETGTIAAAFGGVTSIIDYAIPEKNQSLKEALNIWHEKANNKAVIDYGFHMSIVPPVDNIMNELSDLVNLGVTSIKCFFAYKNSLMIDDASFLKLLEKSKELGILVCVHAENGDIIDLLVKQCLDDNKTQPIYHALSRPPILEGETVNRVLRQVKRVKTPVYFVHVSTQDAIEEISIAREQGYTIYTETCPQYLLLNQDRYYEPDFNGAKYVMSPPLRDKRHSDFLLNSLKEGQIDVIATDHCPFNFNGEKQSGKDDFTKIPNGISGIETRLPLMFDKMVVQEGMSLTDFVNINCTNPAKIFGLQNKGDIQVGMDADILIFDPETEWTIKAENLHQNVDYTPFENFKIKGKPISVVLRGNIMIENNKLLISPGFGKFINRSKINDD